MPVDFSKFKNAKEACEEAWKVSFGDVPKEFLESVGKHDIKIRKADIDFLYEAARKEGLEASTIADLRRLSETELFWFAKYVLNNPDFTNSPIEGFGVRSTHGDICDFYIRKDKTKSIAEQDAKWKERLLLYPRGSFKSTANMADTVQWILNFSDIRILLLTATRKLSVQFLDLIKKHFLVKELAPSYMNQLFPEFCVRETDMGPADQFMCPQRKVDLADPTVSALSVESALSGHHYDLMKCSDIISNENSGTEDQLTKATKNFYLNKKMLMQYGYLDVDGTRYNDLDTYGDMMEKNENTPENERRLKIICEPGWKPKPGFEGKTIIELEKDQVYLLFDHPNFLSYENLRHDYRKDELVHEGQIQQNPRPAITTLFDRPLLIRQTVPFGALPFNGPVSITWDFAFSQKRGRDYTAGIVGQYNDRGQLFIIDMAFGRFKPADLAKVVVSMAKTWNPMITGIEDVAGSRFLEPSILQEARNQGIPDMRIDWFTPPQEKEAKKTRMAALHPWLTNNMLFFSAHLPNLETLYKQFELCLVAHHHEDIPDAIAHQLRYAPRIQAMIVDKSINTWSRDEADFNLMYIPGTDAFGRTGLGPTPSIVPVQINEEFKSETPDGLPNVLGAGLWG